MTPRAAGTVLDRPAAPVPPTRLPRAGMAPPAGPKPTSAVPAGTVAVRVTQTDRPAARLPQPRTPPGCPPTGASTCPRDAAARDAGTLVPRPRKPRADPGLRCGRSDAVLAAHWFLTACLEVINGYRPASHLRCLVEPDQMDLLLAGLAQRAPRHAGPGMPRPRDGQRIRLRRARVCQVSAAATETAAVFGYADSCWAVAIRLERLDGHWRCTLAQPIV